MNRRKNKLRKIIVWLRNAVYTILAIAIFSLVYVFQIEPQWFEVVSVDVSVPNLASAFNGFTIVQISDVHADTSMNQRKLSKIVKLINRQQPDIIAMTGDFVTIKADPQTYSLLEKTFKQFSPTEKTVGVLGNHDHWSDPNEIRQLLHEGKALDLNNTVHIIERNNSKLAIAGVDDNWAGKSDLDAVLKQLESQNNPPAILLAHEPDFADVSAATHKFALQISGHSHGGQIRLRNRKNPPVLPRMAKKYPVGRYQVDGMVQYTNRGVGMVSPAVRFNCRPEITVFTLNSTDRVARSNTF